MVRIEKIPIKHFVTNPKPAANQSTGGQPAVFISIFMKPAINQQFSFQHSFCPCLLSIKIHIKPTWRKANEVFFLNHIQVCDKKWDKLFLLHLMFPGNYAILHYLCNKQDGVDGWDRHFLQSTRRAPHHWVHQVKIHISSINNLGNALN